MIDSTHVKAHRSAAGGNWKQKQAIGRSREERNTKIHALADANGRLIAILLTGGEAHDYPLAKRLIRRIKPPKHMLGDTAYDGDELREKLDQRDVGLPIRSARRRVQEARPGRRLPLRS